MGDFFGGAIAALIALPYGMAMASLMGLPPILGVYTSLFAVPVCVLLGRNPVLIGGTPHTTVAFILVAVRGDGSHRAAKDCFFAGPCLLIFCVLRPRPYAFQCPRSGVPGLSCGRGGL